MATNRIQLAVVGDANIGKTFLLESWKSNTPIKDNPKKYKKTNGTAFYADQVTLSDGTNLSVQAIDISSDKTTTQFKQSYTNKDVILLCFAVDQPLSLYDLKSWRDEILKDLGPSNEPPIFALVAIQRSPEQDILLHEEQAKAILKDLKIDAINTYFADCSDQKNLHNMFAEIYENNLKKSDDLVKTDTKAKPANVHNNKKPTPKSPSRFSRLLNVIGKFLKEHYLKIILGTLLVAAVVTTAVFLWPLVVTSAAIIAAAAAITAVTSAIGFAVTATTFTATILSVASALIIGIGAFILSKVGNPQQPKNSATTTTKTDTSKNEVKLSETGRKTSQIMKPLKVVTPKKSVYLESDSELSSESLSESDNEVIPVPAIANDDTVTTKITMSNDDEESLSESSSLSR